MSFADIIMEIAVAFTKIWNKSLPQLLVHRFAMIQVAFES